jgi:hypothetical protein
VPECAWQVLGLRVHVDPGLEDALQHLHPVHDQALDRTLHVEHLQLEAVTDDQALVGDLAAGLGVERRLLEHDLDGLALLGGRGHHAVTQQSAHLGVGGQLLVAGELGGALLAQLAIA